MMRLTPDRVIAAYETVKLWPARHCFTFESGQTTRRCCGLSATAAAFHDVDLRLFREAQSPAIISRLAAVLDVGQAYVRGFMQGWDWPHDSLNPGQLADLAEAGLIEPDDEMILRFDEGFQDGKAAWYAVAAHFGFRPSRLVAPPTIFNTGANYD